MLQLVETRDSYRPACRRPTTTQLDEILRHTIRQNVAPTCTGAECGTPLRQFPNRSHIDLTRLARGIQGNRLVQWPYYVIIVQAIAENATLTSFWIEFRS